MTGEWNLRIKIRSPSPANFPVDISPKYRYNAENGKIVTVGYCTLFKRKSTSCLEMERILPL